VGSTERAAEMGDNAWSEMLNKHDAIATDRVSESGGRLVKTTGDGLLATFDGPSAGIAAARAIRDSVEAFDVEIRAGVHTGEVEIRASDVGGIGVHIGARIAALAGPGEILVSRTVKDLVTGSGIALQDRGTHSLKGVPDAWQVFAVDG
jgi:class 3 adenylate cyclase